jgi:hypothetical protein
VRASRAPLRVDLGLSQSRALALGDQQGAQGADGQTFFRVS